MNASLTVRATCVPRQLLHGLDLARAGDDFVPHEGVPKPYGAWKEVLSIRAARSLSDGVL
jgi:hypothetical protein